MAAVTPKAGRRAVDDGKGRVGGLLSPELGAVCEVDEGLDLEDAAGVAAGLRLTIVERRFGGTAFLFWEACRELSCGGVTLDLSWATSSFLLSTLGEVSPASTCESNSTAGV